MTVLSSRRLRGMSMATLYSTCQCVLSVVGSIGVILLFAGIPQLIYAPSLNVGNLLTFMLGALLITAMVAGNAVLNFRYQEHCRRDADNAQVEAARRAQNVEDKPPSYETLAELEGLPAYHQVIQEKPPRYEDITNVVVKQMQSENSSLEKNLNVAASVSPMKQALEDSASNEAVAASSQLNKSSDIINSAQQMTSLITSNSVKESGNYEVSDFSGEFRT